MPLGPAVRVSTSPPKAASKGSTSPAPPSPSSTLGSRQAKNERSHVEWVSETRSTTAVLPRGPPHIGKRDELLKENKALFKKHEDAVSELREAERKIARLHDERAADAAVAARERNALEEKVALALHEVEKVRTAAAAEQRLLQLELDRCRAELQACSGRLVKTHEALGLTADKARRLELSEGRLQIDLDGTLSTLEDAQRRHEQQWLESEEARVRRETDLTQQLHESETQRLSLERLLKASRAAAQSSKEEIARLSVAFDTEKLELTHTVERLVEKIADLEANQLDPTKLVNLSFAAAAARPPLPPQMSIAIPHPTAQGRAKIGGGCVTAKVAPTFAPRLTVSAGSGALRGRLQNMVPPSQMASPTVI